MTKQSQSGNFRPAQSGYEWVADDRRLAELAARWLELPRIALDTEFIRERTYFPQIALYQVNDGQDIVLVDPLALDCTPLATVFASSRVTKVMHSCGEDVEAIERHLGVLPAAVFDTQLACAFVSDAFSPGYQTLVANLLGETVDKSQTRSDWLRRPLQDAQLAYAAADVEHLLRLHDRLGEQLTATERTAWFDEDMGEIVARSMPVAPDQYYLQMKDAWRLPNAALPALRALATWREQAARSLDRPRGHVVPDAALLALAERRPDGRRGLEPTLSGRAAGRYGDDILAALDSAGGARPDIALPQGPVSRGQSKRVKVWREAAQALARELNMAEALLARRKDMEELIRALDQRTAIPAKWQGWRGDVVRPVLT